MCRTLVLPARRRWGRYTRRGEVARPVAPSPRFRCIRRGRLRLFSITFGSLDAAGARRPALSLSQTKTAWPLSHTIPWGSVILW